MASSNLIISIKICYARRIRTSNSSNIRWWPWSSGFCCVYSSWIKKLSYSQSPDTNSDGDEYAAIKLAHKKFLKVGVLEKKSCPYLLKGFLNEWSFSNKIWNRLTRKRLGLKFYMNHSWNNDCLDTLWLTRWTLNQFVFQYRGGNRTDLSNKPLMKSDYWWIWWFNDWSKWEDLNLRPIRPKSSCY